MIKNNKGKMLVSSFLILLPMLLVFAAQYYLPDRVTTHWGADGTADGWGSPVTFLLVIPLILLALHWLLVWLTGLDRRQRDQNPKVIGIIFWIMPVISVMVNGIFYITALEMDFPVSVLVGWVLAALFVLIGNYMPKCTQNHTMGIKIHWTLANEQNWDHTHRFAGKLWVVLGVLMAALSFLPQQWMIFAILPVALAAAAAPAVYSYRFYRKQLREGTATKEDYVWHKTKGEKIGARLALCAVPLVLAVVAVLMFTGNIETRLDADTFTVQATYWEDATVAYRDVQSIEYLEDGVDGARVMGFASARLQLGRYQNEQFGNYIRYTYTASDSCIVMHTASGTLVLSAADTQQTEQLYLALLKRLSR